MCSNQNVYDINYIERRFMMEECHYTTAAHTEEDHYFNINCEKANLTKTLFFSVLQTIFPDSTLE